MTVVAGAAMTGHKVFVRLVQLLLIADTAPFYCLS